MRTRATLRDRAVTHLRATLETSDRQFLRTVREHLATCPDPAKLPGFDPTPFAAREAILRRYGFYVPTPLHHGYGTYVRNVLRQVIPDSELPPVRYDGREVRNWDDHYAEVLAAAARRPYDWQEDGLA